MDGKRLKMLLGDRYGLSYGGGMTPKYEGKGDTNGELMNVEPLLRSLLFIITMASLAALLFFVRRSKLRARDWKVRLNLPCPFFSPACTYSRSIFDASSCRVLFFLLGAA